MITHKCKSGLEGWAARLRSNYKSFEEFEVYSNNYSIAERLGFKDAEEAWDENPFVHGSVEPSDFGLHEFPDCYLHVRECKTGEEWIRPISSRTVLDLPKLIRMWVKHEYDGELYLDGKVQPRLDGDYYATVFTDNRPPDSVVCWVSGGFWLTEEPMSSWVKEVEAKDIDPDKTYFIAMRGSSARGSMFWCQYLSGKENWASKPGIAVRYKGGPALVAVLEKNVKLAVAVEVPADADKRWKARKHSFNRKRKY